MAKRPARARGSDSHGGAGMERWLLTYADLITLLMVFFIVMYALSQADLDKFQKLGASMQQAFNPGAVLPGGASTVGDEAGQHVAAVVRDFRDLQRDLGVFSGQAGEAGGVGVEMSREGIVIRVYGNLLFEPGKATLQEGSQGLLSVLARRLRAMPNKVRIEGHTDDIPITTALYASNWELSTARALALVHYMSDAGVAPQRLSGIGYGEFQPVAPNDTREGRAQNRRVDIVIIYPDSLSSGQDRSAEGKLLQEAQKR